MYFRALGPEEPAKLINIIFAGYERQSTAFFSHLRSVFPTCVAARRGNSRGAPLIIRSRIVHPVGHDFRFCAYRVGKPSVCNEALFLMRISPLFDGTRVAEFVWRLEANSVIECCLVLICCVCSQAESCWWVQISS